MSFRKKLWMTTGRLLWCLLLIWNQVRNFWPELFTEFTSCFASDYSRLSETQKENLGQFVIVLHSYWGQGTLPLQVPDIKAVLELCAKVC